MRASDRFTAQRSRMSEARSSPVKVALIHNFHDAAVPSGEDATVHAESAALTKAGFDVRVIGGRNDDLAGGALGPVRAAATIITGVGVSPEAELASWRPDVIHVHNLFPFLSRRWLPNAPAPIVTTAHSFRAMCVNGYLFRDGQVCTRCVDGSPWSGVRFGCYRDSRIASVPPAIAGRHGAAGDPLLTAAQQVLVLSERARTVFAAAGLPAAKLRLDHHFIPDALDPGRADAFGRDSSGAGRPLGSDGGRSGSWVFVGRLTAEKGIDRLVAEWPADEPLRIVGDGPLRGSLEAAAAGKNVRFIGQLSREAVMGEIRGAFGLVFPSRWYETFGLTYIEALAAGVPTLAFAPNVVADAVRRDGTGAIAAWGALDSALTDARAHFDGLRVRCREVFEDRYTETAFISRRTALYDEVAA